MRIVLAILGILQAAALPLQQTSLVSMRTTVAPPSGGGNQPAPTVYRELVLEEWSSNPVQLLQTWNPNCTLPGLQTELMVEGYLNPRYPYGDGIWFLCRDVPPGTLFNATTAPVSILNLQENGQLTTWITEAIYPAATSAESVWPYEDSSQGLNVFYLMGGGKTAGPGTPARASQPRIRVDTGPGLPPDTSGPLTNAATNINPYGLTIMTDTVYMKAFFLNGTSNVYGVYQVGSENVMPTVPRNLITNLFNEFILSSYNFPYLDLMWWTGFNRVPFLARTNFTDPNPQTQTRVFPLPAAASSGTLGGASWRVNTARFEGAYLQTGDTVYLNNNTAIVRNTLAGLATGLPYEPVIQAPPGWKYTSIHARFPTIPTPSATATATATSTASSSASASATASPSSSSTATATSSPTSSSSATPTSVPTSTSSPSASSTASPSASAISVSQVPQPSATPTSSFTPSTTPSNGTIPQPANAASVDSTLTPAESTGIGLGVVAFVAAAGLFAVVKIPALKNLYTRQFGSRTPKAPQGKRVISKKEHASIEISQNPYHASMARIAQLKAMQDFNITKHAKTERTKKIFAPSQTPGESV